MKHVVTYPLYAQRDPRWRWTRLGFGNCSIGSDGCVITSIGMMVGLAPDEVNRRLMAAHQFSGSLVSIAAIPYQNLFTGVEWMGASAWFNDPVPSKVMVGLRTHLDGGNPAIVCVDSNPGQRGVQYHYMLATGVATSGEIIVNDPWYGVTAEIQTINKRQWVSRLLRGVYGLDSAHAIYRIDFFKKLEA